LRSRKPLEEKKKKKKNRDAIAPEFNMHVKLYRRLLLLVLRTSRFISGTTTTAVWRQSSAPAMRSFKRVGVQIACQEYSLRRG
jgi:hypothetical protein